MGGKIDANPRNHNFALRKIKTHLKEERTTKKNNIQLGWIGDFCFEKGGARKFTKALSYRKVYMSGGDPKEAIRRRRPKPFKFMKKTCT